MTTLEMIKEWEKGCSCAMDNPIECQECTMALIEVIKKNEIKSIYSTNTYDFDTLRLNIIPQIGFYRFNVNKASVELKGDKRYDKIIKVRPIDGEEK